MMGNDESGGMLAGLVIKDDDGRWFLIGWDTLLRFRVPEAYHGAVMALVHGAEPPVDEAGRYGSAWSDPAGLENALLQEVITGTMSAGGRLAARRLAVWALLR